MKNQKGFTLIELLLVVMIIGFLLAVIVPRGLRATTDAKYNLVRQNCAELAAYGNDWVEQQILAQDVNSTATRADYLESLVSLSYGAPLSAVWIAKDGNSNWNDNAGFIILPKRNMNNIANFPPDNTVQDIIDPAKVLRNPFNGASVFLSPNDPSSAGTTGPVPGAIAVATQPDNSTGGTFDYYSFIFQGTDSDTFGEAHTTADYHAGMDDGTLAGVREGVFFTKVRQ